MGRKRVQSWWLIGLVLMLAGLAFQLVAVPNPVRNFLLQKRTSEQETENAPNRKKPAPAASIPYHPLRDDKDLELLLKEIGDAQVVLLGEATHGTSEFYTWRATITRRLILEKGFIAIAIEGDWPESQKVNEYITGKKNTDKSPEEVLRVYDRWPTWMWANHEVAALVSWLREHNKKAPPHKQVGFYGLDLYSLCKSLMEISDYLKARDGSALPSAQKAVSCYREYSGNPEEYARSVYYSSGNCKEEFNALLMALQNQLRENQQLSDEDFDAEQNALVAVNAENYYRTAATSDYKSWNIRDQHMMQTLSRVLKQKGAGAKIVVWEHNTHIGDARATDMAESGMVNIGQLARQQLGAEKVYAIGFGTYTGTVIAATAWERPMKTMRVPNAMRGSWEHQLHEAGEGNKLVISAELRKAGVAMRPVNHRAIGVVYDPATETNYNYVPSRISKRYDAFIFIDKTSALHPLETPVDSTFPPSLHPWVF